MNHTHPFWLRPFLASAGGFEASLSFVSAATHAKKVLTHDRCSLSGVNDLLFIKGLRLCEWNCQKSFLKYECLLFWALDIYPSQVAQLLLATRARAHPSIRPFSYPRVHSALELSPHIENSGKSAARAKFAECWSFGGAQKSVCMRCFGNSWIFWWLFDITYSDFWIHTVKKCWNCYKLI